MTTAGPAPILTTHPNGHIDVNWPTTHNPRRIYSVTGEFLERTIAEHNRVRDGADPTPRDPAALPTPGQLWHQLITANPDDRTGILARLIDNTSTAADCHAYDHAGQLRGGFRRLGIR